MREKSLLFRSWFIALCVLLAACTQVLGDFDVTPGVGPEAGAKDSGTDSGPLPQTGPVIVNPVSGLFTSESGRTATFTIVLKSAPTDNVVITMRSSTLKEGTVAPLSVTFTKTNWSAPQTVTVTGVDDKDADGNKQYTIITSAASTNDPVFKGFDPPDVSVTNIDNETAGFTVLPVSGLMTSESGGEATFTVVLNTVPTADVTIELSSGDPNEGLVAPTKMVFTKANAAAPQMATVTGVNDSLPDGPKPYKIVLGAAKSADPTYDKVDPDDVEVVNADNDTAGFTIKAMSGNGDGSMVLVTTETGQMATFSIALNFAPVSNVVVRLTSSNTSEGVVSPTSLTFTPTNWKAPQIVTVSGIDDLIADGDQPYQIMIAPAESSDPAYKGLDAPDVSAINVDDEKEGVTVKPLDGLVTTEAGGGATFTIALNSKPTDDVTIPLSSSDVGEVTVSPAQVVFTKNNWNAPRTVTVTGVDDAEADGNQLFTIRTGAATSNDGRYSGLDGPDVKGTNRDDDSAGIIVTPTSGLTTSEKGDFATFTIALTSKPTADVVIVYESKNTSEGVVSSGSAGGMSVRFTKDNYAAPQTVTVTGVDDKIEDGNQVYRINTFPAESTDQSYNGLPVPDVELTNIDDDTAGITLKTATADLQTSEKGDTATFTLVLNSQPTMPVTIDLSSSNDLEGTIAPRSLTFTADNWSAPRTVTITGQDDRVQDGNQQYRIVVAPAKSPDAKYNGIDIPDLVVTNVDNDQAGITVKAAAGLTTNETGMTAVFTVELNSQPTASVIIPLVSSRPTEGSVSPAQLTFTTTDWNAPQIVTVTGVNDFIADGNQAYTIITQPAQSGDTNYADVNAADVSLSNIDDDSPGFIIAPTTPLTTTEDGGSTTFSVRLQSQPIADVSVVVRSSDASEGRTDVMTLVFTAANYASPHVVTVTGVNDDMADGNQTYKVILDPAASTDPNYDKVDPLDVNVVNSDNDSPGITVSVAAGDTKEDGTTTTFSVRLTSQPTSDVTVPLESSNAAEGAITQASLVFTTANWSAPQTVTVRGVDDSVADGNQQFRIILKPATSADPNYAALDADDVVIVNVDNDKAGISVSAAAGPTNENGGTTTFTVVLNSQPTADVTIPLSSSNTNEGTVMLSSIGFTTVNWAAPQTVTVRGVNDFVADGNQAYKILLGPAAGGDYAGIDPTDVDVVNIDDDSPGFIVTPTSGLVTGENGSTATFTVQLTSQPTAPVTVGVHSNDVTEGAVNVSTLTFTATNYGAPQTVTVRGLNDDVADGNQTYKIILDPSMSTDGNYNGRDPEDVSATNTDNDSAGITVSVVSGKTNEGGAQATFTVVLNSQPTADVAVHFNTNDASEGTVDKTTLTFNSTNWSGEQTVTITGVNDDLADGEQAYAIVFTATTSLDAAYAAITPGNVLVRNTDNDSAGINVSPISGKTNEGGAQATFTVVLNSQPTADVTVHFNTSDATEGTVDKTSLTFNSTNWNGVQTVTVTGINDDLADGEQAYAIIFTATTSGDGAYAAITPDNIAVRNTDDDSAGITVSAISGKTNEGGGQATFTVVLNSEPTAPVTLQFNSNDTTEGVVDKTSLVFTTTNWKSAQTVTVTGVNDDLADGEQTYAVVFTATMSGDNAYAAIVPGNVVVKNSDNDSAGINVSAVSGNTTEVGGQATFDVVLHSQPTADVVVHLSSNDTTEGTVDKTDLTFTPMNWSGVQTVTITGVNDDLADGDQNYAIVFAATTSSDSNYTGITPGQISLKNTDNDSAGINVSAISGKTSESGNQATFTVSLNSQPTGTVTLNFNSNNTGEGTLDKTQLVFTTGTWSGVQTVTVTGINDFIADGDQSYAIVFAQASSSDAAYAAITPGNINVINTDNDSAGINVSAISGDTAEAAGAGHSATFSVVLNSQPAGNNSVTVNLNTSDATEGTVDSTQLVFNSSNWSAPQVVTVTGVDDAMADGNVGYQVVFGGTSSNDTAYSAITPAAISLLNIDNDSAGINVSAINHNTTEAVGPNHTATFTIVLNSQPSGSVTVNFNSNNVGEGTVNTTSVTFDGTNPWNVAQTVTVTGVDDHVADGNQPYAIAFTATTAPGDSAYAAITPGNVNITNIDNGTPAINVTPTSALTTTEVGGTATFTIVLGAQPSGAVTVHFHSDDTSEGTVDHATGVSFDTSTWNVPQIVTVTGIDDAIADGNVPYHVVFDPTTGGDAAYDAITPGQITYTNIDDDAANIVVGAVTNGGVTTEAAGAGHTASFTVVLTAQPVNPVVIHLDSNDMNEGTVDKPSLTFDGSTWSTAQTVTITSVDDAVDDAIDNKPYAIVFTGTTGDSAYSGKIPATIPMVNVDNDGRGIEITGGACTTVQGGPAFTLNVRLQSQPIDTVTLNLTTSDGAIGTISGPTMLTFLSSNWSTAQTFDVLGGGTGGPYNAIVTGSSTDANYNGLTASASCSNTP